MKKLLLGLLLFTHLLSYAQDTFSIVAVDPVTGEVGSAGASCLDLFSFFFSSYQADFIGDVIPGKGAINTQAYHEDTNQDNARTRMLAGDNAAQIINWLVNNDVYSDPQKRQYGIAAITNGVVNVKGYTGTATDDYKNHIEGPTYVVQGNILLGKKVLDSMEARFKRQQGSLACKLMAAMQGAKMVGADTRCATNGTSSLFAFLKVAKPTDAYGSPSLLLKVKTHDDDGVEPIDLLQTQFNNSSASSACGGTLAVNSVDKVNYAVDIYPNPSSANVKIVHSSKVKELSYDIKDMAGNIVQKGKLKDNISVVDIRDLLSGVYFLILNDGKTSVTKKIIKE
ncbi:DUF1028 domain-containing protein [Chryseobacterium populi]|uniref:Por secretion system C-terminal sorting domain containing protein n=1 Tax=Chryseobacterium populi TaxID=1144316 RepID=J2TA37_9FLAO|nr:DUF1028 domain-containing protein [Chryseobacterium populi]EJL74987.1 Por secretion system C-terminal sorting domain containing protein [Chryseobacterium populi]